MQARRVTARFRSSLVTLSTVVAAQAVRAAARPDAADIDSWWDGVAPDVHGTISAGSQAAARLASSYVTAHAAVEGVTDVRPVLVPAAAAQVDTSTRVRGPVAYKQTITRTAGDVATARHVMLAALEATARRLVAAGARQTVLATVDSSGGIIGYRRVARGNACAFCVMLVSRGAVYASREGATLVGRGRDRRIRGTQSPGASFHDHCYCTAEPIYSFEAEPPEVLEARRQWEESGGTIDRLREYRLKLFG